MRVWIWRRSCGYSTKTDGDWGAGGPGGVSTRIGRSNQGMVAGGGRPRIVHSTAISIYRIWNRVFSPNEAPIEFECDTTDTAGGIGADSPAIPQVVFVPVGKRCDDVTVRRGNH